MSLISAETRENGQGTERAEVGAKAREAARYGKGLPDHGVQLSVAGRSVLFELEKLLNEHQAWLSKKVPEWDERYLKNKQNDGGMAGGVEA